MLPAGHGKPEIYNEREHPPLNSGYTAYTECSSISNTRPLVLAQRTSGLSFYLVPFITAQGKGILYEKQGIFGEVHRVYTGQAYPTHIHRSRRYAPPCLAGAYLGNPAPRSPHVRAGSLKPAQRITADFLNSKGILKCTGTRAAVCPLRITADFQKAKSAKGWAQAPGQLHDMVTLPTFGRQTGI